MVGRLLSRRGREGLHAALRSVGLGGGAPFLDVHERGQRSDNEGGVWSGALLLTLPLRAGADAARALGAVRR